MRLLGRASFITDSHSGFTTTKPWASEGDDSLKGGHARAQFELSETGELVLRGNYTRDHGSTGVFMVREISPTALGISPENIGGFLTVPGLAGPALSLAQAFGLTFPQAGPTDRRRSGRSRFVLRNMPTKNNDQAVRRQRDAVDAIGRRDVEADYWAAGREVDSSTRIPTAPTSPMLFQAGPAVEPAEHGRIELLRQLLERPRDVDGRWRSTSRRTATRTSTTT